MLVHKDISEVKAHQCKLCPYKTKRKSDLPKHMLIHKDYSENPKTAQTRQESMSEQQELEGCFAIKSEEVDIKDEED
ncbi:hypothetical protein NQ318_000014 [Aromia moschata]|uniref:C2H2-type domain-containing protein n=1 Tax=Aromia moschata TaxID=1265417 RepID=A0AAV8YBT8_9CUCU|nr:hypothetical protein NQ318_000014 [Aromia moschata]